MFLDLTADQERIINIAKELAAEFAARAERHDREGSFPFENIARLKESGYIKPGSEYSTREIIYSFQPSRKKTAPFFLLSEQPHPPPTFSDAWHHFRNQTRPRKDTYNTVLSRTRYE